MIKADCRKYFVEKRFGLSEDDHERLSHEVIQQVLQTINLSGKTISLFLPILAKKELNTYPILRLKDDLNLQIALPVADFESNNMVHFLYESDDHIEISKYGIPEPTQGLEIKPEEIDIVFVPLTCFDLNGFRVGYGKGFYDRFLAHCRKDCQFVGLSLFEPINAIEDVNEFDIKLHYCITPNNIYKFIVNNSF